MDLAASARRHADLYFGMELLIRRFVLVVVEEESIAVGGEEEGMGRAGVVAMAVEEDNAVGKVGIEIVVAVGIGICGFGKKGMVLAFVFLSL